jgi:hypothetical protein
LYALPGVGAVHGDAIRQIQGTFTGEYVAGSVETGIYNVIGSGAFFAGPVVGASFQHSSGTTGKKVQFSAARVAPTANKVQGRAWGALACVYLG